MRTEAELLARVVALAQDLDLFWHHETRPQRGQPRGWVDLVLVGKRGALFVELKASGGRRSRDQLYVAALLENAGLEYRLWFPGLWHGGIIRTEMEKIA